MSDARASDDSTPLLILTRTEHELIVVKPAGLPCEMPYDSGANSVVRWLGTRERGADQAAEPSDLRLVHRLDAAACGLLVIARTAAAAAHYSTEIAERRWHKWYVARVAMDSRRASSLAGSHKAYLKTEGRLARIVRAGGKPSFLDVVLAAPAPDIPGQSDLLIRLHTGRFHQIRAMLAHLGAPLAGDARYGGPAAAAFHLEHVLLAARPFGRDGYAQWLAPAHRDRPAWHPSLVARLDEHAATQAAELGIPMGSVTRVDGEPFSAD